MKHHILQSLIALLLLLGISQNAFAYDWSDGKTVYFDNAVTQWSAVYVIIGRDGYSRAYKMEAEPNTTLYKYTMSDTWKDYTEFVIASSIGKSSLDGGGVNITEAYSTCTSRINGISDSVADNILITVTGDPNKEGNTSIYSYTSTSTFNIEQYNVPVVPKKATHLMIFNTNVATKSAWMWIDGGRNNQFETTVLKTVNVTTLSYYDNSVYQFAKAIPFKEAGTSETWPDGVNRVVDKNIETGTPDAFPDRVLYFRATEYNHSANEEKYSWSSFTHLSATFDVSSTTAFINEQITLKATPNKDATLYKDGGNSAEYAFYVKDAAGTISCISDFSTNASVTYTAPSTAQTLTLYCYVRDLYGLETIQYTKEIKVIDTLPTPKTVSNLIIFNTDRPTLSANLWNDEGAFPRLVYPLAELNQRIFDSSNGFVVNKVNIL